MMIFVTCLNVHQDEAVSVEMAVCNYFMTKFPQSLFMGRSSFVLLDLMSPTTADVWTYRALELASRADALYFHGGVKDCGMEQFALENEIPILDDEMDVELFANGYGLGIS